MFQKITIWEYGVINYFRAHECVNVSATRPHVLFKMYMFLWNRGEAGGGGGLVQGSVDMSKKQRVNRQWWDEVEFVSRKPPCVHPWVIRLKGHPLSSVNRKWRPSSTSDLNLAAASHKSFVYRETVYWCYSVRSKDQPVSVHKLMPCYIYLNAAFYVEDNVRSPRPI